MTLVLSFAFKFNLRRYTTGMKTGHAMRLHKALKSVSAAELAIALDSIAMRADSRI